MSDLTKNFQSKVTEIFPENNFPKKLAVAISGGCDSLALTILLSEFCQKNKQENKIELLAVTIDHKIRQSSTNEAVQLNKILTEQKISHQILQIDWQEVPQSNIEAKLRNERYNLLHNFCLENEINFLFLGHIQSDIAENFIIRLFRGSGLDGLSAISQVSDFKDIKLVRPLLDVTKDELKSFLREKNIKWFEDETNEDEKFLRNKVRNFLNSFEEKDFIQKRIKDAADEISQMRDLFDELMLQKASEILELHQNRFITLNVEKLSKIEKRFALKILALVLMEVGKKPYKPRLEKLQRFYSWIVESENHKPRNFYCCMAKTFDESRIAIYNEENPEKELVELNTILEKVLQI